MSRIGKLGIKLADKVKVTSTPTEVKFEGPKGKYDRCMAGQNQALQTTAEWMEEIIGSLQVDYDAAIESEPCPKATVPVAIEHTTAVLENRHLEIKPPITGPNIGTNTGQNEATNETAH